MLNQLRIKTLAAAGAAAMAICSAGPAAAQSPAEAADGEWLTLSGSVTSTAPESFVLDYGAKTIVVEMDDYDWYNENAVRQGDEVTVTGRMDADFWENRTIEAGSVYVDALNKIYFASTADEEHEVVPVLTIDPLTEGESVTLTGTVTRIDDDEMVLDAGLLEYQVDLGALDHGLFDNDRAEKIAVGERVSVLGKMDDADLFDRREIVATAVTELG